MTNKPRRYFTDTHTWDTMRDAEKAVVLKCRTGSLRINAADAHKNLAAYQTERNARLFGQTTQNK